MRSALALLVVAQYAEAADAMFPRAESGDGYLSIPVGTIQRPHKVGKRSAIDAVLENMDFFYAIESEFCCEEREETMVLDTGREVVITAARVGSFCLLERRQLCLGYRFLSYLCLPSSPHLPKLENGM